jgi:hypothetical protein
MGIARLLGIGLLAASSLIAASLIPASPAIAQKEHPGIFRNLIDNLTPDTPEQLENEAIGTRDAGEALKLYGSLLARHPDTPQGVRAALWIGLYSYGTGDNATALEYFERARKHAREPELRARAAFWCDAARLAAGAEPLPDDRAGGPGDRWEAMRSLVRVDRSIRSDRPREAEEALLSLEGDARRAGLVGLMAARWGSVLALAEPGRGAREGLRTLERSVVELPESVYLRAAAPAPQPAAVPEEVWSVQLGAFLEEDNAKSLRDEVDHKGCEARVDEDDEDGRHWYRVRTGECRSRTAAESLAVIVTEKSGVESQIVRIR